ncbi:MAG: hypothetical protein H0U49_01410, partial [Parachlamydiaceae bacterium]|nr:hypothetical protein [Parachlamydiaceae bacterium]
MTDTIGAGLRDIDRNLQFMVEINKDTKIQGPVKSSDTTAVSQTEEPKYVYSPPGTPRLPVPGENADPTGLLNLNDLIQNFLGDLVAAYQMVPSPETEFLEEIQREIDGITPEQLRNMEMGLPDDQVIKMVKYAVFNPEADMPEAIKAAAAEIRQKAIAATGMEPSNIISLINEKTAEFGYGALLKSELIKKGLSPEVVQQLMAAHEMPEFVSKLSPEMQKMLANAENIAFKGVQEDVGIPNSWKVPRNPEGYKLSVANALEQKIGDTLYDKFINGNISKAAYNDLRTLLYIEGSSPPNSEALKEMLAGIKSEARAEVQKDWGFPNDYQPSINAHDYTAILTGTYYAIGSKAIAAQTPPLSAEDQALLKSALSSPAAKAQLSPKLKEILEGIEGAAVAKVSRQYGLPDNWTPDVGMLANAERLNTPNLQMALSALALGLEYYNKTVELLKVHLPGGKSAPVDGKPTSFGSKLLNYLKVISAALTALQEVLFATTITNADLSKMMARIEKDAAIGRLAAEKKSIDEIKAKQAKMAAMGPLKAIIMIIVMLLLWPLMVGTGGMFGALLFTLMFVNTMAQSEGDINKLDPFTAFTKTMSDLGTAIGGKSFGKVFKTIMAALVMVFFPAGYLLDLSMGDATLLTTLLTGLGIPADIVQYIVMAMQIIFMILTIGVSLVLAPQIAAGQIGAIVTSITSRVTSMLPKFVVKILSMIMNFLEKVSSAANSVTSAMGKVAKGVLKAIKKFALKSFFESEKSALKSVDDAGKAVVDAAKNVAKEESKLAKLQELAKNPDWSKSFLNRRELKQAGKSVEKAKNGQASAMKELKQAKESLGDTQRYTQLISQAEDKVDDAASKLKWMKESGRSVDDIASAKDNLVKAEKELMKVQDDIMEECIDKPARLLREAGKAADDVLKELDSAKIDHTKAEQSTKSAKEMLSDAKQALAKEPDNTELKSMVDEAEKLFDDATKVQEKAAGKVEDLQDAFMQADYILQKASDKAIAPLTKLAQSAEMGMTVVQSGISINNSILQAQMAIIKGDLEAYIANIEMLIKIFQSLIAKLLQALKDLGKDLSNLGDMMQQSWSKQSQAMT